MEVLCAKIEFWPRARNSFIALAIVFACFIDRHEGGGSFLPETGTGKLMSFVAFLMG